MSGKNLSGMRFGRLTVICRAEDFVTPKGKKIEGWLCRCDCGKQIRLRKNALTSGNTKSCGCLSKDVHSTQEGFSGTRLYSIWLGMKKRCYLPSQRGYSEYGGRGIKVCEEWLGENGFLNFKNWALNNGYAENLSIDRKNGDGNYEPSNCRWASDKIQNNNRRINHYIEFEGERLTLAQWQDKTGIRQETIRRRLKKGWSVKEALTILDGRKENR